VKKILIISLLCLLILVISCKGKVGQSCPDGRTVILPSTCYFCGDGACDTFNGESEYNCIGDCMVEEEKIDSSEKYESFVIKVYSGVYGSVKFPELPRHPDSQTTLNLIDVVDGFYKGAWMVFYTDYDVEPIRCQVKEYYDGEFFSQFTEDLSIVSSDKPNHFGSFTALRYEEDLKPKRVRYDYSCTGIESDFQYVGSYFINLNYEEW